MPAKEFYSIFKKKHGPFPDSFCFIFVFSRQLVDNEYINAFSPKTGFEPGLQFILQNLSVNQRNARKSLYGFEGETEKAF